MDQPSPGVGDDDLFNLLYVSELATGGAGDVAQICRQSRLNNQRDLVTGVLVFDGHAFCQFVEGPRGAVSGLLDRLKRDPRHVNMHVLEFGRGAGPRRFASWRLGYAYSADPEAIARIASSNSGSDAVAAFEDLTVVSTATDASAG